MRKALTALLALTASLTLVACGGGGTKASTNRSTPTTLAPTTAVPTTTASTAVPSTTLAPGETSRLAEIANQPPPGYRFVDAPANLSLEIQSDLRSDSETAQIIKGFSLHAVVQESSDETIGDAVLMQVEPVATGMMNVEDLFLKGAGASSSEIQQVTIGGTTWSKAAVDLDGSSQVYVHLEQDVLYVMMGSNSAQIEAFITAAQQSG